jgi:hypothetical protein
MTTKVFSGIARSLKPLFINDFTREFAQSFKDPDDALESKLDEICSQCPFNRTRPDNNGSGPDLSIVNECRKEYFGQLLQSFVGRPGDDETKKLFSYFRKCEKCLFSKMNNAVELQNEGQTIQK